MPHSARSGCGGKENPFEEEDAKKQFPEAHFATLHSIVGVKNHESPNEADHVFKGRVVLGGHDVRDSTGAAAVFSDIGNTPSTMAAARVAVACEAVDAELTLLQSDCKRAYTQAKFEDPQTFIRLPKRWWPEHWRRFKNPVRRPPPFRQADEGRRTFKLRLGVSALTARL